MAAYEADRRFYAALAGYSTRPQRVVTEKTEERKEENGRDQ
jgi:hypothetical protein